MELVGDLILVGTLNWKYLNELNKGDLFMAFNPDTKKQQLFIKTDSYYLSAFCLATNEEVFFEKRGGEYTLVVPVEGTLNYKLKVE